MDLRKSFEPDSDKANSPEAEQIIRDTCSLHEKQRSALNQPLIQHYQEHLNHCHQTTSLYLTKKENSRTKLIIYDTESGKEEERILNTPEPLNHGTSITQLPNGDLFCFSAFGWSGVTLIIDRNFGIRVLPSGPPCCLSSAIYFDNNVYCFGGWENMSKIHLALSYKFDLNKNRWISLTPMWWQDHHTNSVLFNRNIFISGYGNNTLLLYSADIDSFSTIPYEFTYSLRKILISIEKIYLIECYGWIYESEDGYNWKQISNFIMNYDPYQVYWTYNKEGIYISTQDPWEYSYFKFDLNQNRTILYSNRKKTDLVDINDDVWY